MKPIIRELKECHETVYPDPVSPEYSELQGRLSDMCTALLGQLPREQGARVTDFMELRDQLARLDCDMAFERGFLLGARLMLEAVCT